MILYITPYYFLSPKSSILISKTTEALRCTEEARSCAENFQKRALRLCVFARILKAETDSTYFSAEPLRYTNVARSYKRNDF